MGDDTGYWNISAYNRGQMGYRTPNIDRIANEGAILTDYKHRVESVQPRMRSD
jgi:arylsulfatase